MSEYDFMVVILAMSIGVLILIGLGVVSRLTSPTRYDLSGYGDKPHLDRARAEEEQWRKENC